MIAAENNCTLTAREDIDSLVYRLMGCDSGGGGLQTLSPVQYDPVDTPIYELPKGLPVNAPVDATLIEPGVPITNDPAPATTQTAAVTTTQATSETGPMAFIKENPLVVAGAAAIVLYFLTRKKRK